jgi:CubicO group peptidase (beta-lactamase class C family)
MNSAIDQVLEDAVHAGAVPNVAAIVANRDGIIYESAAGPRVVGESDPVTTDTEFRIMSMTKMVATTVALQQREQGKLDFDAPVAHYLPEFADLKVLEGFDGDTPRYREPASQATIKQLVTHTSGLGYWFWNEQLVRWEAATGVPNVLPGKNEAFKAPLLADPGTKFNYGINIDWLGKVVEAVAGKTLDVLIKEGISGPLGMDSTTFAMSDAQRATSTPVHIKDGNGNWISAGDVISQSPDWWAGGHGLHSTPRDYIRFEQALLRNGELDGQRILTSQTVDEAFANQIGELDFPAEIPTADPSASDTLAMGPGFKWGFGLLLNTADIPGKRRAGTGAWAGLFNSHFWIDRTTGICASIYSNTLPFVTPGPFKLYDDFERAVYASL